MLKQKSQKRELKVPYVATASDGFNTENLAYYRALFNGMNSVYIHLQNLLFVVVGGFFLATLGGGKIQKYLENRGQSTGNKEPYLHKFFIPLLCAGVFYMPITSGGGVNSTMIQKIIQYFSIEANNIADVAGSIGAKIYMDKVYATAKINNSQDVLESLNAQQSDTLQVNLIANRYYQEFCIPRWDNLKNGVKIDEALALANFEELTARASEDQLDKINELKEELNRLQQWDTHNGMNNIKQDITLQACAKAKKLRDDANQDFKELKTKIDDIKNSKAYQKKQSSEDVIKGMQTLDERLATRDEQLGWLNSILLPSSALILELQKVVSEFKEDKAEVIDKNNKALNDKTSKRVNDQAVLGLGGTTELVQQLTYLFLPGAGSVFNFLKDTQTETRDVLCGIYTADKSAGIFQTIRNAIGCEVFAHSNGYIFGAFYTAYLYEKILSYLPVLIISVAAILSFVGYITTLCKYFYISPFVVAFALTTKRVDKIINFLVTGVTIFFKPVLIVLFIYLALFLYTLIGDFLCSQGLRSLTLYQEVWQIYQGL